MMRIAERYAGFSQGEQGGNPAGVLITQSTLSESEMLMIAKSIGDSETVFAVPGENNHFAIRYFIFFSS